MSRDATNAKQLDDLLRQELRGLEDDNRKLRQELKQAQAAELDTARVKRELFNLTDDRKLHAPGWTLPSAKRKGTSVGVPVLCLSDLHWSETVDPAQVGGVNSYNMEIGEQRLKRIVTTAIELSTKYLTRNEYPGGIVVPLIGDMLSGDIHEELSETNLESQPEALLSLEEVMINAIKLLADAFGKVFLPCVVGNHPRTTKKPRAKNAVYTNFDWLLYRLLERAFKRAGDKRVVFDVADSLDLQFAVCGTIFQLTHGDQFRGGGGIQGALSPWMIGDYRKRKRQQAIKQNYDYLLMGHWHQLAHIKGIIVNGAVKGYDEWSYRNNFDFEPAQQWLFIVNPDYGINYWMPVHAQER